MDSIKAQKFFQLAQYQADLFSKDPHRKVAAILLAPDSLQILSAGYNGMCRGMKDTEERWQRPAKYKWVCHAEMNAIANAARGGVKVENAICIVTLFPCTECCKMLIQSGVDVVVTSRPDFTNERWGEDFKMSLDMMEERGLKLMYVED